LLALLDTSINKNSCAFGSSLAAAGLQIVVDRRFGLLPKIQERKRYSIDYAAFAIRYHTELLALSSPQPRRRRFSDRGNLHKQKPVCRRVLAGNCAKFNLLAEHAD